MNQKKGKRILLLVLLMNANIVGHSQNLLGKNISLDVNRQQLSQVLEILSNKGNFYFSYNSNILKKDSLVSMSSSNKTVKEILEFLLPDHYEFRESGNYIIIRKAPIKLTVVTNKAVTQDKFYMVSGYVMDDETGHWIRNASIYEKTLLASTLTNDNGYFKLKLKHKNNPAALTISKEFYQDITINIDPGFNQEISVTIVPASTGTITIVSPDDYFAPDQLTVRVQSDSTVTEYTYTKTDSVKVERTAMGEFLISSRQKIQSLNLKQFFTTRPFQFSITPGLSTHGTMAPQVINNFSLNVFGGYNGGVNGMEIGGLFNIDKKSVRYFQAAGLFNIVGGDVKGFQVAGINNTVLDSLHGMQVGGVSNFVKGKLGGVQVSGVYNHVTDRVNGVQIAGVANFANHNVNGTQISGVANITTQEITGVQISGVINYAKHVKGVQIGLINIADSTNGVGIGLINIVFKGYHKLSFYADEVVNANSAFKTGNRKLYNILHAGMNFSDSNEVFTFGYGFGTELRIGKIFTINPELTAQHLYLGSWDYANILSKFRVNLNLKLGKYFTLFGGPVFNAYYTEQDVHFKGYRSSIPPAGYHQYKLAENVKGWLGWNAGISFF
ncbi:MAG: carboxypeptidase-like regulatory domain-containing protein [Flavisolibacter sp.]